VRRTKRGSRATTALQAACGLQPLSPVPARDDVGRKIFASSTAGARSIRSVAANACILDANDT
jgi:hypothetical protein